MDKLINYFKGDEFVSEVWKTKYGQKNEESPDDMHLRMATEFAKIRFKKDKSKTLEQWREYFFDLFKDFNKNIPQGRVMAGLGVQDNYRSLSNCLRLPPPKDSYSSIMYVDTMLVSAAKRGCGYGVGLSYLRPKGSETTNAANTSTGVIPFGERYSNSTKEVGQEGRRGACLEDLDIRHPDSPYWATIKIDKTKYTGANISFKVWNDFMESVEANKNYMLRFPVTASIENATIKKEINAKELWNNAIHSVWSDGCPGLQFWDKMVNYDPASVYKEYEVDGTNACGEQPMTVFDTCRLLTQKLLYVVKNPFTKDAYIDYQLLEELSYIQLEVGDDLIDLEIEYIKRIINKIKSDPEPLEEKAIELSLWTNVLNMAKNGRRVGCGITALADMLAAIGIKYDSKEALSIIDKVMYTKMLGELKATINLAKMYGPFKGWNKNLEYEFDKKGDPIKGKNEFYQFLLETYPEQVKDMCIFGRRNVNWSTIAPVGTTSIVTKAIKYPNVSSGCEPQFGLWYFRNKKVETDNVPFDYVDEVGIRWKQFPVIMGAFKDYIEIKYGRTDFDSLTKEELQKYYEESPWHNALAADIDWRKRVEIQAVLQKYTTSAISSTINLPKNIEESVISDIYMYAWKKGLKGITCYRDGSKGNVLTHEAIGTKTEFGYTDAPKRPKELNADLHIVSVKGTKYGVVVGLLNNNPYEVFAFNAPEEVVKSSGKIIKRKKGEYDFISEDGNLRNLQAAALHVDEQILTRLVSGMLRHGMNPWFIIDQINKVQLEIVSFGKAITRVLKQYIKEEELKGKIKCLDCGGTNIILEEGCSKCRDCGSSKC